jgi:hypothetical protein
VQDAATDFGYEVVPSSADLQLPVDDFSKVDALVLRYRPDELCDGIGGCAIDYEPWLDGEGVEGEDVVFWYRSGALHAGGNPWECDIVGPTLLPLAGSTGTEPPPDGLADGYELEQARPNPFNPTTTLRFRVAAPQRVALVLYDALGRRVATLFEGYAEAGRYETVRVDGTSLPSGSYTVSLEGEAVRGSTRIVLMK